MLLNIAVYIQTSASYSNLMLESPQLPSVIDLSFDYNRCRTRFNIVQFANIDFIIISNIEKIGQIVHVSYTYLLVRKCFFSCIFQREFCLESSRNTNFF